MKEQQRIMVVDNDQEMSKFLDCMLEQEGFATIVVTDTDSAPNMLDNASPDLVILELTPPDDDSFKILDLIRRQSDVPVIVLSTDIKAESLEKAFSHGADDYIRMPFGIKSFMARVHAKLRYGYENTLIEV